VGGEGGVGGTEKLEKTAEREKERKRERERERGEAAIIAAAELSRVGIYLT